MKLNHDLVLTKFTNRPIRETYLGLIGITTRRCQSVRNVTRTDRPKELAFLARCRCNLQLRQRLNRFSTLLGSAERCGGCRLKLRTTRFELFNILRRGRHCFSLWDKEVTAIAWLHINTVTQSTKATYVIEQNYFHRIFPSTLSTLCPTFSKLISASLGVPNRETHPTKPLITRRLLNHRR